MIKLYADNVFFPFLLVLLLQIFVPSRNWVNHLVASSTGNVFDVARNPLKPQGTDAKNDYATTD